MSVVITLRVQMQKRLTWSGDKSQNLPASYSHMTWLKQDGEEQRMCNNQNAHVVRKRKRGLNTFYLFPIKLY